MTYIDTKKYLLLPALVTLALSGCSRDTSDLEQFVQQAKATKKSKIAPLPEIKPHETFRYEASHLRHPFEPFVIQRPTPVGVTTAAGNGPRPIENRPREALEAFPLDTLRMVGTLDQEQTWALIKANDGTIHRVKAGNYMGQNHGKILRITETNIELMEIVPDGLGNWTERAASLALSE